MEYSLKILTSWRLDDQAVTKFKKRKCFRLEEGDEDERRLEGVMVLQEYKNGYFIQM